MWFGLRTEFAGNSGQAYLSGSLGTAFLDGKPGLRSKKTTPVVATPAAGLGWIGKSSGLPGRHYSVRIAPNEAFD